MNTMMDLLAQPLAQQLGWCLAHFLWQGALLAGVYALARGLPGALLVLAGELLRLTAPRLATAGELASR